MIKLIDGDENSVERVQTLFADTKEEVPATGSNTVVEGYKGILQAGSILYTAKLEVAVLKSDDNWEWGE